MADVCISYDGESAESVARQICETLEKDGISCWYMGRDMRKGALRGVIAEEIQDCRVFLVILSAKALQSAYVKAEIALAAQGFGDNREQGLIAFLVDDGVADDARKGAYLQRFLLVDGCPPDAENLRKLKNAVLLRTFPKGYGPASAARSRVRAAYL